MSHLKLGVRIAAKLFQDGQLLSNGQVIFQSAGKKQHSFHPYKLADLSIVPKPPITLMLLDNEQTIPVENLIAHQCGYHWFFDIL